MATPHVAGVAALIVAQHLPAKLTTQQIQKILQTTADPLSCPPTKPYQPAVRTIASLQTSFPLLTPPPPLLIHSSRGPGAYHLFSKIERRERRTDAQIAIGGTWNKLTE